MQSKRASNAINLNSLAEDQVQLEKLPVVVKAKYTLSNKKFIEESIPDNHYY